MATAPPGTGVGGAATAVVGGGSVVGATAAGAGAGAGVPAPPVVGDADDVEVDVDGAGPGAAAALVSVDDGPLDDECPPDEARLRAMRVMATATTPITATRANVVSRCMARGYRP